MATTTTTAYSRVGTKKKSSNLFSSSAPAATTPPPLLPQKPSKLSWLTCSELRSCVLFVLLLPLVTCVLVPLWLASVLRNWLLWTFQGLTPLTPHDSIFAVDNCYDDDNNSSSPQKSPSSFASNVTLLFVDGDVDVGLLRSRFSELLTSSSGFSRLRSVLVKRWCGFYLSSAVDVNISSHVRKVRDFDVGLLDDDHVRELEEHVGVVMTRPFPRGKPLWEVEVFGRFKNHQSVVLVRIHHAICDGYSFNHLVDQLILKQSQYLVKPSGQEDAEDKWTNFINKVLLWYRSPRLLFRLYEESLLVPSRNVFTRRKVGRRGFFSMTTLDLSQFKLLRRRTRTHFATVGMTLMVGALRRFLQEKAEQDQDQDPSSPPPPPSSLLQVPVGPVSIMHSLPKPSHPISTLVNHWNVGLFKNDMSLGDPLLRLQSAESDFLAYTSRDRMQCVLDNHIPLLGLLPSPLLSLLFSLNFGTGMGFTSVPAYEGRAHLLGQYPVLHMCKVFGLQWQQTAIASAVYTHNGEVGFTMFGHEDVVGSQGDMERIVKVHLLQEFQELANRANEDNNSGSGAGAGRYFA